MDKASCMCEFSNGGRERSGILCNYYGNFTRVFSCTDEQFCTGPISEENAVESNVAHSLLCSGKMSV